MPRFGVHLRAGARLWVMSSGGYPTPGDGSVHSDGGTAATQGSSISLWPGVCPGRRNKESPLCSQVWQLQILVEVPPTARQSLGSSHLPAGLCEKLCLHVLLTEGNHALGAE